MHFRQEMSCANREQHFIQRWHSECSQTKREGLLALSIQHQPPQGFRRAVLPTVTVSSQYTMSELGVRLAKDYLKNFRLLWSLNFKMLCLKGCFNSHKRHTSSVRKQLQCRVQVLVKRPIAGLFLLSKLLKTSEPHFYLWNGDSNIQFLGTS